MRRGGGGVSGGLLWAGLEVRPMYLVTKWESSVALLKRGPQGIRCLIFGVSPTLFWIRVRFSWARTAPPTNLEPRPHPHSPISPQNKTHCLFSPPTISREFKKKLVRTILWLIQPLILNQKKSQLEICKVSVFFTWYLSKVIKLKIIEQFVIPPLCNN